MSAFVQTLISYVLLYKYWALFCATFIASLAIPIPAGTLLVASAAFASQGYFNIGLILAVVIIANIAGDSLCFWIARLYGKRMLNNIGLHKMLLSKNYKNIEARITERPGLIIFISRFEAIATLSVNIACGLSGVSYRRFIIFESMGAIVDAVFYGALGFLFGDSWQAVNALVGKFSIFIFLAIAVCIMLFWKKIMKIPTHETI